MGLDPPKEVNDIFFHTLQPSFLIRKFAMTLFGTLMKQAKHHHTLPSSPFTTCKAFPKKWATTEGQLNKCTAQRLAELVG